jgi:ribonuclease-3
LTHKSHAFEKQNIRQNERLEFLGDSVLAAVVAHYLFENFPQENEGRLSKIKAAWVSQSALTRAALKIELGRFLLLGAGEEKSGGRQRPSILANAFEALIGAIYIDGGYETVTQFIQRFYLDRETKIAETDYKSQLQEIVQKRHKVTPEYKLVKTSGPDHDKTFLVLVQLGSQILGTGCGKSKKEAEQQAALNALRENVWTTL